MIMIVAVSVEQEHMGSMWLAILDPDCTAPELMQYRKNNAYRWRGRRWELSASREVSWQSRPIAA